MRASSAPAEHFAFFGGAFMGERNALLQHFFPAVAFFMGACSALSHLPFAGECLRLRASCAPTEHIAPLGVRHYMHERSALSQHFVPAVELCMGA